MLYLIAFGDNVHAYAFYVNHFFLIYLRLTLRIIGLLTM